MAFQCLPVFAASRRLEADKVSVRPDCIRPILLHPRHLALPRALLNLNFFDLTMFRRGRTTRRDLASVFVLPGPNVRGGVAAQTQLSSVERGSS
jgi:hypothetical protein